MQAAFRDQQPSRVGFSRPQLIKGTVWGLIGGLVATLVMDIILMSVLAAGGIPPLSCFSIVGDTMVTLFSSSGMVNSDSIPLGIAAHYLIGPLMGGMFGAAAGKGIAPEDSSAAGKRNILRVDSMKKVMVLAVLYAEILSQPLLAMAPILLRMEVSDILQWYGGSLVMHMIWGCVLGMVWSQRLRLPIAVHHE